MKSLLRMHHPSALQDLVLLVARIGLGSVLVAHGWQKFDDQGIAATTAGFDGMGIPYPEVAAHYSTYVELVGGVLLGVGLLTPLVGLLVVGDMAGAFWFVHRDAGVFVDDGGWELVIMIGLLALTLVAVGAGRLSVDGMIAGGKRRDAEVAPERQLVDA